MNENTFSLFLANACDIDLKRIDTWVNFFFFFFEAACGLMLCFTCWSGPPPGFLVSLSDCITTKLLFFINYFDLFFILYNKIQTEKTGHKIYSTHTQNVKNKQFQNKMPFSGKSQCLVLHLLALTHLELFYLTLWLIIVSCFLKLILQKNVLYFMVLY